VFSVAVDVLNSIFNSFTVVQLTHTSLSC